MTTMPTNKNQLVLLVDDDEHLLEMAKTIFEYRGHRVLLAWDFQGAAKALHENMEPMWAFVDLNLAQTVGDNSGAGILEYIKNVAHHRVALNAWTGEANKDKWTDALRTGAINVVPKWLDDPEYLAILVEESDLLRVVCEVATDSMTGLYNFAEFKRNVIRDMKLARDRGQIEASSMIAIDLDHFKQINDLHGHRKGDEAIRFVADVLRSKTRGTDHLCRRYKGDEFLVSMPGAVRREAEAKAREYQKELVVRQAQTPLQGSGGTIISVKFTYGVAQLRTKEFKNALTDQDLEAALGKLIDEADHSEERGLTAAKKRRG